MTNQEAIARMKYRIETATDIAGKGVDGKAYEDMEMAIQALKLANENMERSDRYYNGDWILCSDRLPKENEVVLLTFQNSAGLYVGESTYKESMFFYITDTEFGYNEEVFKNPIAWQPLPEPYKPQ